MSLFVILTNLLHVALAERCGEFGSQRKSIMKTLLADYDKATFPAGSAIDVQAEASSCFINFLCRANHQITLLLNMLYERIEC